MVLGAGPAGIGAGLALRQGAVVLERQKSVAGLCRSLEISGALFDLGGHSFHTPHPAVRDLVFRALPMEEQGRQARCSVGGALIPYPFQKHFRALPWRSVVRECAGGLAQAGGGDAADFESYLTTRFGEGIARRFLLPYNRKLWGENLARLSPEWAAERVAAADGSTGTLAWTGGKRAPLEDDTRVAYPARGGFGEIFHALARGLANLRLGTGVRRIDVRARRVTTEDGESLPFDRLISTLPIPSLLKRIGGVPAGLKEATERLEARALKLLFLVIDRPVETEVQRIYTADSESPVHKIVINHNSSDSLRARPRHGISGEMAYASGEPPPDSEDALRRFLEYLRGIELVRAGDRVVETRAIDVPHGYPVPSIARERVVAALKDWLFASGIATVGRFGEWAYINSDEALVRGWDAALETGQERVANAF